MVVTSIQLWKDYDRTMLPLRKSLISSTEKDGTKISYYYYNGEAAFDGVTRVFCKLVEPLEKATAAVLVMDDYDRGVDLFDYFEFVRRGFAVLIVDYAGNNPSFSRFTIYPKSLHLGNAYEHLGKINAVEGSVKLSSRYIWATCAMRGITLLEELGYDKVMMLGVGDGGNQVYKAALFENNLVCAAVKYSGTLENLPDDLSADELAFKTALSNISYSKYIKCPLLLQITSNEQNSGFDEMNEFFDSLEGDDKLLAVSPRCNKMIEPKQKNVIPIFFSSVLESSQLPKTPTISMRASEKSLYVEVSTDSSLPVSSVTLLVAYSQKISAYRNWHNQKLQKISENEYLSKVPVYSATEPVYAFVNVSYENGLTVSSPTETVIPKSIGVEAVPAPAIRRLYDNEMGVSDWIIMPSDKTTQSFEDETLSMEDGPFEISGVTCSTNKIATLTLADSRFQGNFNSVLQLIMFSPENQTITFAATSSLGFTKYYCTRNISPSDNWSKFSLSPQDFRSGDGTLQSFSNILTFEIHGESKFLVNSLLWV